MTSLPAKPGIYAIQLCLLEASNIKVGGLANWVYPPVDYIYVGSAQGPGGLNGRLGRHLHRETKQLHWHIDYLKEIADVTAYFFFTIQKNKTTETTLFSRTNNSEPLECRLIKALLGLPGAHALIPGFGSSDCRMKCPAHLVAFPHFSQQSLKNKPLLLLGSTRKVLAEAAGIPVEHVVSEVMDQFQ